MRILVLGDSYCPGSALGQAFEPLRAEHDVDVADVIDEPAWRPRSESERRLREYLGSPEQVIACLAGHEILVVQGAPVTDAVLDAAPIRLVCVARGGPVNVDVAAATKRGIPIVTTPGKNADAVAELTVALMVMLARRLAEAVRFIDRGGSYGHDNYEGSAWFGHNLAGRTLGLVGFGQVARRVARRAQAFEMDVIAYDPFLPADAFTEAGVAGADLDRVLATADHVSVHARLTADNRGMFDASRFGQMRPGAMFINTARSELVDEAALLAALRSGHLGGAALDVAQASPISGASPFRACPNVIVLPHLAGATYETLVKGGEMAAAEVTRMVAGKPLRNVANPGALDVTRRPQ
jgi:D-3-phosphoglycerate dehydrogenase